MPEEKSPTVEMLGDDLIIGDETPSDSPVDQDSEVTTSEEQAPEHSEESFTDPGSVPEELKVQYKSMQAAFTRKTQELAEQRRSLEDAAKKAELFDQIAPLLQDTEFQQAMTAYKEGRLSLGSRAETPEDDEPEIDPAVRSYLDRKLSSVESARQAEGLQLRRQMELRDLAARYPDWREKYPKMLAVLKEMPQRVAAEFPLEKAYRLASYGDLATEVQTLRSKAKQFEQAGKKRMSVSPGRSVPAEPVAKPPKDIQEAARRAIAKMQSEGYGV